MKKLLILLGIILAGCSSQKSPDAFGNFEAIETIVSSEANGKILYMSFVEGQHVAKDEHIATVDTTLAALQKQELSARRHAVLSKIASADAQIAVVQQQVDNLDVDLERVQNMLKDDAATQKQLDDLTGAKKVLQKQLEAAQAQRRAVTAELDALDANLAVVEEQLRRCFVKNPVDGVVLEKYSELYEMTAAGKPLYKIANLNELMLRAFVSGGQLNSVKIGQQCTVRIDNGDQFIDTPGTVSWISDTAEFTPRIIQTKEERVNLVYAVKIRVNNENGAIKIGMPGEVLF